MQSKTFVLALLFALAVAAPAAAAPKSIEEDDKLVLQNDHVTVWFQGKKPMLKVFPTANATEDGNVSGAYGYKFTDVVEYRDVDGDGMPSNNEVVASLNLDKASAWTVNRSETAEGGVVLNLTLKGPVKMGPKADGVPLPQDVNVTLPDRDADVGLVFTIHDGATTVQVGDANVTVPATSVKYDFVVNKWPFVDASTTRLALVMQVDGALEMETGEGVEGATVASNETQVGVLAWVTTAQGNTIAGEAVDVPVKTAAKAEGNATRIAHTYDAPGLASLVHDPTIGVAPTQEAMEPSGADGASTEGGNTVPGPAVGLALSGIAVVALALRRR